MSILQTIGSQAARRRTLWAATCYSVVIVLKLRVSSRLLWKRDDEGRMTYYDRGTGREASGTDSLLRAFHFAQQPQDSVNICETAKVNEQVFRRWVHAGLFIDPSTARTPLPSKVDEYNKFVDSLPDRDLIFMNHGYASLSGEDDFSWLLPEHRKDPVSKYSFNLVTHLMSYGSVEGHRVLDVGCGRGGAAVFLSRYLCPTEVVGVDAARGNVEFCVKHHACGSLRFLCADAVALPFSDNSFDAIVNIESSHCYTDLRAFFAHTHRILRQGGTFYYTDVMRPEQMPYVTWQLKAQEFQILFMDDLRNNVGRCLELLRPEYKTYYRQKCRLADQNENTLSRLDNIPQFAERYLGGSLSYPLWIARKQ
jgi:ubiquinone/menaquinone biosynthesis C-methylase UbiE